MSQLLDHFDVVTLRVLAGSNHLGFRECAGGSQLVQGTITALLPQVLGRLDGVFAEKGWEDRAPPLVHGASVADHKSRTLHLRLVVVHRQKSAQASAGSILGDYSCFGRRRRLHYVKGVQGVARHGLRSLDCMEVIAASARMPFHDPPVHHVQTRAMLDLDGVGVDDAYVLSHKAVGKRNVD